MVGKFNGFLSLLFLSLLSTTFLNSCDECYECDVHPDPYVNVKFIKSSDLNPVNDSINDVVELLATKRKEQAELTADAPVDDVKAIKTFIDSLNSEKVRLEKRRNLLQSGMVKIDTLLGDFNKELKITSDSATTHQLPLSMNKTTSSFKIYLHGHPEEETLTLTYKKELLVEDNRVIIKANSIEDPPVTSFDSPRVSTRDDRKITDETTIYLYY